MINILNVQFDWAAINSFTLTVGVVGVIVVFIALVVLSVVFTQMPRIMKMKIRRSRLQKKILSGKKPTQEDLTEEIELMSGEASAAVSAALYMYFNDMHDIESGVLTMDNVDMRKRSPWSNKAFNMNPVKK